MTNLKDLPVEVSEDVKSVLRAYNLCNVVYYNGLYHATPDTHIMREYPQDHKVIGCYYKNDVYTLLEQIDNYRNSFHCEPYMLIMEAKEKGLLK